MRTTLRRLWRQPGVLLAAVAAVGVTIGFCAAFFSVLDGLLFRPLPIPDGHRIVFVDAPSSRFLSHPAEGARLLALLASTRSFTERARVRMPAALFLPGSPAELQWQLRPAQVSPEFFSLLRVVPAIGRPLEAADARREPVPILIGHSLWLRKFGADPSVVGRTLSIPGTQSGKPWQIIGVMPEAFDLPRGTNLWAPFDALSTLPQLAPDYARLADGVSIDAVRHELPGIGITPLREHLRPNDGQALVFLGLGLTLLLCLALTQAASVVASASVARTRETTIKLALGASLSTLHRERLYEVIALTGAAAIVGALLTGPINALILSALSESTRAGQRLQPDVRTALFVSGVIAAVLAWWTWLLVFAQSPKKVVKPGHEDGPTSRLADSIFFCQVAAVTALCYLTGLLYVSFRQVVQVDLGFDPRNVTVVAVPQPMTDSAPGGERTAAERMVLKAKATLDAVRALPGVEAASWGSLPMGGLGPFSNFAVTWGNGEETIEVLRQPVSGDYIQVIGARLREGRLPSAVERNPPRTAGPRSAVTLVNRSLARVLGRSGTVVGQELRPPGSDAVRWRVIGVIDDIRQERPDLAARPMMYPYIPDDGYDLFLLVRTAPGMKVEASLRGVLEGIWGEQSASIAMQSLEAITHDALQDQRARLGLMAIVAIFCMPLALFGIAGTVIDESRRRRKITAICIALGATRLRASANIVLRPGRIALAGIATGLVVGAAAAQTGSAALFGVQAVDSVVMAITAVSVVLTSCLASIPAAKSATTVDPASVLRQV